MYWCMEIILFSLVSFFPYLLLEITAFRNSLRFSPLVTTLFICALSLIQIGIGLFFAPMLGRRFLTLIGTLLSGLAFLLLTQDHTGKKLFTLLMIGNDSNLVIAASEYIQEYFLPELTPFPYHWTYSLVMLCIECIILAPMFFYVRKVYAQTLSQNKQLHAWNYLWLIPLTFYLVWLLLYRYETTFMPDNDTNLQFLLITLILCLSGLFVYIMVAQLIKEHRQNEDLREKEYILTMRQTQYANLQDRIEEARRAKHDLRHHLHLVSAYLKDGKLEELKTYLQKYSDAIPDDNRISYCDHYTTNALLMYFASQAKASGIAYHVSADLPTQVYIPDEALAVVLGNLLENAIAACKEEPDSPVIHIYGRMDDSAVFFKITNTCTKVLKKNRFDQYYSTKPNGHGIGLNSVRNITQQYDGIMEAEQKNNLFTVSIMLNIPDDTEN